MEDTGWKHQGKRVLMKETPFRICSGCLYSDKFGGVYCSKPYRKKCMKNGKEYIFILEDLS